MCGDLIMKMPSIDTWRIDTYLGLQGLTERGTLIEEDVVTDLLAYELQFRIGEPLGKPCGTFVYRCLPICLTDRDGNRPLNHLEAFLLKRTNRGRWSTEKTSANAVVTE